MHSPTYHSLGWRTAAGSLRRALLVLGAALALRCQALDLFLILYPVNGSPPVGESPDINYPGSAGWFLLNDFSLSITNSVGMSSGTGLSPGKAGFTEITLTKGVDSVSPAIFTSLASGSRFRAGTLVVRKTGVGTGPGAVGYLKYDFNNILFTGQQWTGGSGDSPTESIRFQVQAMQIEYRKPNSDGTLAAPVKAAWDLASNSSSTFVQPPASP